MRAVRPGRTPNRALFRVSAVDAFGQYHRSTRPCLSRRKRREPSMRHATVSIRHWVRSAPGWRFAARLRAVRYGGLAMLCAALLCAGTRAAQQDEDSNRDLTQLD